MSLFYNVLLAHLLICVVLSLSDECKKLENGRLSKNVVPHHYDVTIRFDLAKLIFNGNTVITVHVNDASNAITLHGRGLNATFAKFSNSDAKLVAAISYCKEEETISFNFENAIEGNGTLEIIYNGKLSTERVDGIYALESFNGNEVRYSVATFFASTNARAAFPCFDEPNLKATYSVSIIAPKDRTILSTMPVIKNESVSETETKVTFAKSPKMSTYTTSIIIGDFDFLERQSKDGKVPVRLYTPVGRREQGLFALDVAIEALDFLQNYLGIDHSLPKLDLIALKDMSVNAMENWGLIVFTELELLLDENSSIETRQRIARLVCHEIVHQWFGNLVTLDWWSHTWINEAFASLFESVIVNELFKEWNHLSHFLSEDYLESLGFDSLHSSHPIEVKEPKFKEIDDITFDAIVYKKGSSILRMLKKWIGDEDFKKGLRKFLKSHEHGNAGTDDVLDALESVTSKPVKSVMNNWFKENGYPMLSTSSKRNGFLWQQKYCANGNNSDVEREMFWKIPVIYSTANSTSTVLFGERMEKIAMNNVSDWNVGSFGFYRTLYRKQEYDKLFSDLKHGKIKPEQRFALQNDFFEFAKSGIVSTVDYLKYIKQYASEDHYFVWKSIGKSLSEISLMLSNANCSQKMSAYTRSLIGNLRQRLNKRSDNSEATTLLRVFTYQTLGLEGDENIIRDSVEKFIRYYNKTTQLDQNFRSAIMAIAAANADDHIHKALFDLFKRNSKDTTQRGELTSAMGNSGNVKHIREALNFSLSKADVTNSESIAIVDSVGRTSRGGNAAWNFFVQNFETYKKRFEASFQAPLLIKGVVASFASLKKANEIETFFATHEFKGIESTLKMSLEMIHNRVKWFERDSTKVCEYLNIKY